MSPDTKSDTALEEGASVVAFSDGDLSMFAMDDCDDAGEIEEMSSRRLSEHEADVQFVSLVTWKLKSVESHFISFSFVCAPLD